LEIRRNMKIKLLTAMAATMLVGCKASDDDSLFQAIRAKDTKEVDRILAKGTVTLDRPRQSNDVNKPLAFAAAYGNLEIVKLILAHGANINGEVAYGDVPLVKAAEHGNKDIIKYLIEQGADVNKPNDFGISPFIGLSATESVELVELGLKYGGKINESYTNRTSPNCGKNNYNALQAAVADGRTDTVKVLLARGGDPSIKDASGKTCLDVAREKGNAEIVRMLTTWAGGGGIGSGKDKRGK
jgi:ankyrin repeat protein